MSERERFVLTLAFVTAIVMAVIALAFAVSVAKRAQELDARVGFLELVFCGEERCS